MNYIIYDHIWYIIHIHTQYCAYTPGNSPAWSPAVPCSPLRSPPKRKTTDPLLTAAASQRGCSNDGRVSQRPVEVPSGGCRLKRCAEELQPVRPGPSRKGFRWIQHYIASHFGVDLYDKN